MNATVAPIKETKTVHGLNTIQLTGVKPTQYVYGKYLGFESKPYKTKTSEGVNNKIGVKLEDRDLSFGETETQIMELSILTDDVSFYQNSDDFKGKNILIEFRASARSGSNGAWLSFFVPSGTRPYLVQ